MEPIDFTHMAAMDVAVNPLGQYDISVTGAYSPEHGVQFSSEDNGGYYQQDIVRLNDDAFLHVGRDQAVAGGRSKELQKYCDSDWIHLQLLIEGRIHHDFGRSEGIVLSNRSCLVARHPAESVVGRHLYNDPNWKVICLLLRPGAICDLLNVSSNHLPDCMQWLTSASKNALEYRVLPLDSTMMIAASDIVNCEFSGATRYCFMRAKSIELLTILVRELQKRAAIPSAPKLTLTENDRLNIVKVRYILNSEMQASFSLDMLACQVGLNRTKLAAGFKILYGTTVYAYLRATRLAHARELLTKNRISVTEASERVGYSQVSSFTRAFTQQFGVSPKDCR